MNGMAILVPHHHIHHHKIRRRPQRRIPVSGCFGGFTWIDTV